MEAPSCRMVACQVLSYLLALALAPWLLAYVVVRRWLRGGDGPLLQFGAINNTPPKTLQDPKWGKHSYICLKSLRMHYVEKGDSNRPLLLLLHGFPEFWFSWRHQLVEFSKDYWVVAVDMRGYGDTEKPSGNSYKITTIVDDIKELVEKLGKKKCILGAHDYGGVVAWIMALKHPDMIEKLIIMNCPHPAAFFKVYSSYPTQWFKSLYMLGALLPWLPEYFMAANNLEIFDKIFWVTEHARQNITKEELEAYKYTFSTPASFTGPFNYYRSIEWFRSLKRSQKDGMEESPKKREKLRVPTLLVWGKKDSFLSLEMAKISGEYVEDMALVTIDEASHWVQQDFPVVVNEAVRDFLSKT